MAGATLTAIRFCFRIDQRVRIFTYVRFTPESGHFRLVSVISALGHKRTRHVKTSPSSRGGLPVRCPFDQTAARPC
jgi:hypothetical protein